MLNFPKKALGIFTGRLYELKEVLGDEFKKSKSWNTNYNHWSYESRFVCITITEDVSAKTFEVNIHPNVDKGYRDPFELHMCKSLDDAKQFATNFMEKET